MRRLLALLSAFLPAVAIAQAPTGHFWASLVPSAGHEVAFDLELEPAGNGLAARIVNAGVKVPLTTATWDGTTLTLELAHFDAKIVAHRAGDGLEGTYSRTTAAGLVELQFVAKREKPPVPTVAKGAPDLSGSWGVEIGEGKSVEKDTGMFKQKGGVVTGTLRSTTGDYGALHGTFDGKNLVLTVFDGVHVYRFEAEVRDDGSLLGEYRTRTSPPQPFRAKRLAAKAAESFLPDTFAIVKPKDPSKPFEFSFADADGKTVSISDPDFKGKPMIVAFMGTWCPNCNDEAPVLRDLFVKYRAKGLAIVALSFEYTDDVERNRRQVKRFNERYGIEYPVLIAGTTKTAPTSATMSQLVGWEGYPTTLFLDREHKIVKTHSGFDGPATGAHFTKLKEEMDQTVKHLLKQKPVSGLLAAVVRGFLRDDDVVGVAFFQAGRRDADEP